MKRGNTTTALEFLARALAQGVRDARALVNEDPDGFRLRIVLARLATDVKALAGIIPERDAPKRRKARKPRSEPAASDTLVSPLAPRVRRPRAPKATPPVSS